MRTWIWFSFFVLLLAYFDCKHQFVCISTCPCISFVLYLFQTGVRACFVFQARFSASNLILVSAGHMACGRYRKGV